MGKIYKNNNAAYVNPKNVRKRICLRCGKKFKSSSKANRRCVTCRNRVDYKEDGVSDSFFKGET